MIGQPELGVTVVLPVFLRDADPANLQLLKRALESVADQNFPGPYEILLVDDSATPIEQLAPGLGQKNPDAQIRFVRPDRNGGLVHALNRGLAESRHPFIARLDADDRWLPTKIEKQFELFARDPDLTITATGMTLVTPSGVPIEAHVRPGDWNGILRFFLEVGCPFPHGSVVARRDIYRLLGGYPHFSHCEDYALWGTWLRFFKPAMVEEALYDYTVSTSSASARHAEQLREGSRKVNLAFHAVSPVGRVPEALQILADGLELGLIDAGTVAYRMWRHRLEVALPITAVDAVRTLMPDRIVQIVDFSQRPRASLQKILGRPVEPAGELAWVSAA